VVFNSHRASQMYKTMFLSLCLMFPALAHDNGQYAQSSPEIRNWFNGLHSKNGLCCSFADGVSIDDPDWRITTSGSYQVFYQGTWYDVPSDALIQGNNRVGHAVLWPLQIGATVLKIRCFMPGSET
jgi:hypothetical protein